MKRLSIAVEIVALPALIFFDGENSQRRETETEHRI
jgi:hypothetical protein